MAEQNKEKEKSCDNTQNPKQEIERLENELNATHEQYENVAMELQAQIQTNSDNMNEFRALQTKYDEITKQNTTTFDDILNNQQNVDKLQILQTKYDVLLHENQQTMEAMEELIIASQNKINSTTNEMNNKYNEWQQHINTLDAEKANLSQTITQLTDENQAMALELDKYAQNSQTTTDKLTQYKAVNKDLNKKLLAQNNDLATNKTAKKQMLELQQIIKSKDTQFALENDKMDKLTQKYNSLQTKYEELKQQKQSFSKYKEKAKNVVNKHKSNAEKQINETKQQLTDLTAKYQQLSQENEKLSKNMRGATKRNETLLLKNKQMQSWQDNLNSNMMSLNNKVDSDQTVIDKLTKNMANLKLINVGLDQKIKAMLALEQQLKTKLETQSKISNKREQTLHKISAALAECSCFEANDSMNVVRAVNKLTEHYETALLKLSGNERVFKENEYKIQLSAITIAKLQTVRSDLQQTLDAMKQNLSQTAGESEQSHKLLESVRVESMQVLEKYMIYLGNNGAADVSECDVLSGFRLLSEYFVQLMAESKELKQLNLKLSTFSRESWEEKCREIEKQLTLQRLDFQNKLLSKERELSLIKETFEKEKHEICADSKKKYATKLEQYKGGYKKESEDETKHIQKLTRKLNHCIRCIKENWHYDISKTDFVDLSISTRLMLKDNIWCLVRWRNKNEMKYHDEYFWCSQAIYLRKLNVKENEIYLPDFFENKLEAKWKAIQRRNDREIQELKLQIDNKKVAKVILKKQKDELSEAMEEIKELQPYREQVTKLKQQLLINENWEEKYEEISKQLAWQRRDFQNKKLQFADIQNRLLLKERELSTIKHEFESEKAISTENNANFKKLQEMLDEKRKQQLCINYDKETQTECIEDESIEGVNNIIVFADDTKDNDENEISVNVRMQIQRDEQIQAIHDQLLRLQELLNKSEKQHKLKDAELEYFKATFMSIQQCPDVQKYADNSQYLKNALLQYFDGKMEINQLLSVVTVGLRFTAEEQKKAQNSKLIVKSWW